MKKWFSIIAPLVVISSPAEVSAAGKDEIKLDRACRQTERYGNANGVYVAEGDEQPKIICRTPPRFSQECLASATAQESAISYLYDVSPAGEVVNIRLISSTNECMNDPTRKALEKWRFQRSAGGWNDLEFSTRIKVE